jgi:cysteine-rich repeat protein
MGLHFGRGGLFILAAIAAGIVACSSGEDENPGTARQKIDCVPNTTIRCLCGLEEGTSQCTDDRKVTPCSCSPEAKEQNGSSNGSSSGSQNGSGSVTPTEPPKPAEQAKCGDGTIDVGEACDDGNTKDGDGCSAKCQPDSAPASADKCPGQPLSLWKGASLTVSGTTEYGANNDISSMCGEETLSPDRVYAVTAQADGVMKITATVTSSGPLPYNAIISVREGACDSAIAERLCASTDGELSKTLGVKKGSKYFVFIDGAGYTEFGSYSLELELP